MQNVHLSLDVLRRRWLVILLTLVAGLVAVFFLFRIMPRSYEAASHVLIVNESEGRDPSVSSIDLPSVATSTAVLDRVINKLKLPESLIEMKHGLKARVTARSSIMEISYRDRSRDLAVAVPNAIADELSRYYEEIATSRADQNVRKLDVALGSERKRLNSIDRQIETQSAAQPFLGSDKALDDITARLDDLESQRQMTSALLVGDRATAQAVAASPGISRVARREMLTGDDTYRALVAGLAKDQAELEFERAAFTDRYPGLRNLQAKVDGERAAVGAAEQRVLTSSTAYSPSRVTNEAAAARANAIVSGDEAKVAALSGLVSDERNRLQALPHATYSTSLLRLQRDAAQADFLALSARRTAAVASRAEALSLGSVVVVDRAVRADTAVVGLPRLALAVVTAMFVLALAFGSAFLIEMLDPRLRRSEQIESLYGSPLITVLTDEG